MAQRDSVRRETQLDSAKHGDEGMLSLVLILVPLTFVAILAGMIAMV